MHGPRALPDDVENPSESIGLCVLEKQFADSIARAHSPAGDHDVAFAHGDFRLCEEFAHYLQVRREVSLVHDGLGIETIRYDDLPPGGFGPPQDSRSFSSILMDSGLSFSPVSGWEM